MSRSRTKPSSTLSAWILSRALSIPSWAAVASDACPGPVGEDHPFPPFHFFTNSVVETTTIPVRKINTLIKTHHVLRLQYPILPPKCTGLHPVYTAGFKKNPLLLR